MSYYIVKVLLIVVRSLLIYANWFIWLLHRILLIIHNSDWFNTFAIYSNKYFRLIWLQHASINCERREHRSGSKHLIRIDCEILNTFPMGHALRMHLRSGRVVFSCTILVLDTVVDDMRYFSEHALLLHMRAPQCPLGKWNAQPMRTTLKPTTNDLTQVADAYIGQFGTTFGTTRSRTALQIQIQIQIRRYTDHVYAPLWSLWRVFFKFIIWTCKFCARLFTFFVLLFGICFCFCFAPFRLAAWLSQRRKMLLLLMLLFISCTKLN